MSMTQQSNRSNLNTDQQVSGEVVKASRSQFTGSMLLRSSLKSQDMLTPFVSSVTSSKHRRKLDRFILRPEPVWLVAFVVVVELLVHASFVGHRRTASSRQTLTSDVDRLADEHAVAEKTKQRMLAFLANSSYNNGDGNTTTINSLSALHPAMLNASYPKLFIFRRTKKTGSSSMMNALMEVLEPLGYIPISKKRDEIHITVRNEFASTSPRRLLILQHNNATRAAHPQRQAVIADTIRDGFPHILSYCRYMRKVYNCFSSGMRACVEDAATMGQMRYRWGGRDHEDDDTYIDLPLSSAHPALSTAVLKTVFPMIPALKILQYNVRGAGCEEEIEKISKSERKERAKKRLKQVYDELYGPLDRQVDELKRRMLTITGYPTVIRGEMTKGDVIAEGAQLSELLDEAEVIEANKTNPDEFIQHKVYGKSQRVLDLLALVQKWKRHENGTLALVRRRDVLLQSAELDNLLL